MYSVLEISPLEKLNQDINEKCIHYKCTLCGGDIKNYDETFYGRCDTCLATLISYKPAKHQIAFHQSKAKFRLNIGGFGSGKTTAGAFEISQHALGTPNGRTLISAQTLQQIKEGTGELIVDISRQSCIEKTPEIPDGEMKQYADY